MGTKPDLEFPRADGRRLCRCGAAGEEDERDGASRDRFHAAYHLN
jgi:hypothetical protein